MIEYGVDEKYLEGFDAEDYAEVVIAIEYMLKNSISEYSEHSFNNLKKLLMILPKIYSVAIWNEMVSTPLLKKQCMAAKEDGNFKEFIMSLYY